MFLGRHGYNILIHKYFQRNENKFISLVLKAKEEKAIHMPQIFLKLYINQSSKQFLLFIYPLFHFSGL